MKRLLNNILIFSIALVFYTCSSNGDCDCDIPELRELSVTEESIIESSNNFSFDIFSRMNQADPNSNIFISPLSISIALSMTANGAAGDTKAVIKAALHQSDLTDEEINKAYKSLSDFLMNLDPKVVLQLANSNWYSDEYRIKEAFKALLLEYYDAEVKGADFQNPGTKDQINDWIETKTNGKIQDMIDQIPPDAVMYLINAIYLKATWKYEFDKEETEKRPFTLANGSTVNTDMMFAEGVKASVSHQNDFLYAELPYGNGQFVFSIILPHDASELNDIIEQIDTGDFSNIISNSDTGTYQVYLPKFKFEYKSTLNSVLAVKGMEQSFGPSADFSNLFEENLSLFISRILHQSFIEVDEEGTEAAAATVVQVSLTSIGGGKPTIMVNKPFAFFIREKHSNSILFAGKLIDPTIAN